MEQIRILDCTLRDGGYCNDWQFGEANIKKVIASLEMAGIEIIECGFLSNRVEQKKGNTRYPNLEAMNVMLQEEKPGNVYVCMINYGEYEAEELPDYKGKGISGIRVAFHKKDRIEAIHFSEKLQKKGYLIFLQPMVSLDYSVEEFCDLIRQANHLCPHAFYIVDSFGGMKEQDLIRLFYMTESLLDKKIEIGFHSHNNMQLAYANAVKLASIKTKRKLIIDSSIFGMGRGAGNLNTELFVEYLNEVEKSTYSLQPLLAVIDQVIDWFYKKNYWGYSVPNYLSAKHNVHPYYTNDLASRYTLRVEDMDEIFSSMPVSKRVSYDKKFMEQTYYHFMEKRNVYENNFTEFCKKAEGKKIVLIASGKNAMLEQERIKRYTSREDVLSVSINFDYPYADVDYIFVSNLRRYASLEANSKKKCILTSNIDTEGGCMRINYASLLNPVEPVCDNAGLMAIKFFMDLEVPEIYLAGMDGYTGNGEENYGFQDLIWNPREAHDQEMNEAMKKVLEQYQKKIKIHFITESLYKATRTEMELEGYGEKGGKNYEDSRDNTSKI